MDSAAILLSVCGLAVVCVGLLGLLAFIVLRFTGANILAPLISMITRHDDDESEAPYESQGVRRTKARDTLRSTGRASRFDEAIERHKSKPNPRASNFTAQNSQSDLGRRRDSMKRLGGASRFSEGETRRRRRDDDDEIIDEGDFPGF